MGLVSGIFIILRDFVDVKSTMETPEDDHTERDRGVNSVQLRKAQLFACPNDHGPLRKTTVVDVLGVGSGIAHVCGSCDGVWIEDAKAVRNAISTEVESHKRRSFYAGKARW